MSPFHFSQSQRGAVELRDRAVLSRCPHAAAPGVEGADGEVRPKRLALAVKHAENIPARARKNEES